MVKLAHCLAVAACFASAFACAVEVNVIGLFTNKAVVVINGGPPRTISAGERTAEGVLLVAADSKSATLEIDGKRQVVGLGTHAETPSLTGRRESVTLGSDSNGHFFADGMVNGGRIRFLVDTGATNVVLSADDAHRLGIDYKQGSRAISQTANGRVIVYRVKLDNVVVGGITILNVDAVVTEGSGLDVALLGMSFLNRTEIRREGENLMLTKRY
jgi:aspartyl protease family protein